RHLLAIVPREWAPISFDEDFSKNLHPAQANVDYYADLRQRAFVRLRFIHRLSTALFSKRFGQRRDRPGGDDWYDSGPIGLLPVRLPALPPSAAPDFGTHPAPRPNRSDSGAGEGLFGARQQAKRR